MFIIKLINSRIKFIAIAKICVLCDIFIGNIFFKVFNLEFFSIKTYAIFFSIKKVISGIKLYLLFVKPHLCFMVLFFF